MKRLFFLITAIAVCTIAWGQVCNTTGNASKNDVAQKIILHTSLAKGATMKLYIAADAEVKIENASGTFQNNVYADYTVLQSPVTITGNITILDCKENEITAIEMNGDMALQTLNCSDNQLGKLNLTSCKRLEKLLCASNELASLDLSCNPQLTLIDCYNNELATLDLSNNKELQNLVCDANELQSLSLSENTKLAKLECSYNEIAVLDLSALIHLEQVMCYGNDMNRLSLPATNTLSRLYCYENNLQSLDVKKLPMLTRLYCYDNPLGSLDVTANKELAGLVCYKNRLQELDLTQNNKLETLECDENNIQTLNLSANEALTELFCYNNGIKGDNMDKLIASLHNRAGMDNAGKLCIFNDYDGTETNVCTTTQVTAAKARGWIAYHKQATGWKPYNGSPSSGITNFVNNHAQECDIATIYNEQGQRLNRSQRGFNIIVTTNGEVKKVIAE